MPFWTLFRTKPASPKEASCILEMVQSTLKVYIKDTSRRYEQIKRHVMSHNVTKNPDGPGAFCF